VRPIPPYLKFVGFQFLYHLTWFTIGGRCWVDEAAALEAFAAAWEQRYPAIVRLWRAHWAEFVPFLAFPPEVRRMIYTTDENVKGGSGTGVCSGWLCPPAAA
jgi:Transposase, Mutator family